MKKARPQTTGTSALAQRYSTPPTSLFIPRHKAHESYRYHEQRAHWFRVAWYALVIGLLLIVARLIRRGGLRNA